MNDCPCCSTRLLKHWKQSRNYWYCSSCRQEMPNLELIDVVSHYQKQSLNLINKLTQKTQIPSPHNS